MVPASRNYSGDIVESRSKQVNEQYHFHQYGQAMPQEAPPPQPADQTVPVLLCHTCSVCGQMRSAGYHRHNPVVPGKPLVLSPCRKCKKKIKSQRRSMSSYTRIRSCTAEEPCDWPSEDVRIDIERHEDRGRRRSRDVVYVYKRSPSRPRIARRSSSQTRFGVRVLQQDSSPPGVMRKTRVRVSSSSPRRAARYGELHPMPDVLPPKPPKQDASRPPPPTDSNHLFPDVWPPPDGVYAHLHRKVATSPPRRQSSRIIELSPSPPPARTRSTRVEIRSESVERRPRSVSPVRANFREERRTEEAEARMLAHPQPFRSVRPDPRNFRATSDETSSSIEHMYRERRQESPGRGILKSPAGGHETSRRRASMRESQQSTAVEVGGSRVHWSSDRRGERTAPDDRGRPRHADDARRSGDDFEVYHNYTRHRYVDDPAPAAPPVEEFDRVRIRRRTPSPRQAFEEELRIARARRISPSPPRHAEDLHIRHATPLPPRERERAPRPQPSPASERVVHSGYRHVSRERFVTRTRSVTPPRVQKPASEDMTDTDSAHSGDVIETRSWKGIDENGKPAIFVEERRKVRMLEQGSDRGGQAEFRPLNERVAQRSWRDV